MESGLRDEGSLDSLGNKVLLEESINIKASDYRFDDKKKIYSGEQRRGRNKDASTIAEVSSIASYHEFEEKQIIERGALILDMFFDFLRREELVA
jgi:hypothetical protein